MARMRRTMGRPMMASMDRGALRGPWLGTHGWRTAPPVVKGAIDEAMAELTVSPPSRTATRGLRGPWLATHGWRTAPPVVKRAVDEAMMDMANESLGGDNYKNETRTYKNS